MQNKNTSYVVLGLVVVVIAVSYFIPLDYFKDKLSKEFENTQNTSITTGTPKFIMGVVSGIEEQKVFIKIAEKEKVVVVDGKTLITKQIKQDGKFSSISANFIEIKSSSRVVVYYNEDPSVPEYKAIKIHILSL